ncbi:hypothetical protein HYX16_01385 [Candidatus Woesearchaeota archaeon]|nr:hypothetical protein [Candidatus Woesearchaeota archaeon]
MKKMGLKQEQIDADEVIIICKDKKIIVENPQVTKLNMMGQETLQIVGDLREQKLEEFNKEDLKMIVDQAGCTEEEARKALKEKKDIAAAILYLKEKA